MRPDAASSSSDSAGQARILIAGASEPELEAIGAMLDRLGHRHDIAFDGQGALTRIDHSLHTGEHYGLVVIDAGMERIDGLETMRRLRNAGPYVRIPIVGLSANILAADFSACLTAGMDMVLHKPVRFDELRVTIETALASTRDGEQPDNLTARYAERRADMLGRINALVGGGDFAPEKLEEIVTLAHRLAESAGMAGDPATGDLAIALEQCVRGFSAGGESAVREAAAALRQAA